MTTPSGEYLLNSELDPKIRIRAPLRCNGVGSLDCAEHAESGMRMAVRWLPLDANGAAAARAVRGLPSHPTLPAIRSVGQIGTAAYVAMDFPDGKLLSAMIGEKFSLEQVRKLGEELADALSSMHAQSVVHGELCADSVLLHKGQAILWDLPLVLANRMTDRRGEERSLAQLTRAAPYLSVERARGGVPTAAADVYSLGAILAHLLGGSAPTAQTTLAILHDISSLSWRPAVPDDAPQPMRAIIRRMLEVEPRVRPSAREVADLLHVAFKPAAITAPELPAVKRATPARVATPPPLPQSTEEKTSSGPKFLPSRANAKQSGPHAPVKAAAVVAAAAEARDEKSSGSPEATTSRPVGQSEVRAEEKPAAAEPSRDAAQPADSTSRDAKQSGPRSAQAIASALSAAPSRDAKQQTGPQATAAINAAADPGRPTPSPRKDSRSGPHAVSAIAVAAQAFEAKSADVRKSGPQSAADIAAAPSRRLALPVLAVSATALALIVGGAVAFTRHSPPSRAPVAAAPVAAAASPTGQDSDLLAPLVEEPARPLDIVDAKLAEAAEKLRAGSNASAPARSKSSAHAPRPTRHGKQTSASLSGEAAAPSHDHDFDFLSHDEPKPSGELKRPNF